MKNKTLTIVLISLLSLFLIFVTGIFIYLLKGGQNYKFLNIYKISNELAIDEEYELDFNELNIESKASDINIKSIDDEKVRLVIYGDKNKIEVDNNSNKFSIKSDAKACVGFCINKRIDKIEVYLPKTYSNKINIKNDYGDIKVEDFIYSSIKIEEDAGDIEINKADSINIDQDYGDVVVGTINDAVISNDYGDIKITKVNNYLDIEEDYGDIKINSININKNSKIKNDLGDIKIGSTNKINIKAKTSLGEVKINNNYKDSDITLTISNDMGDIKIDN